jgi:hypothetical protein
VHLRTSPYGGTTAVVLLPKALLHEGPAERSLRRSDADRPVEREYARVTAAPEQDAVQPVTERPALVSPRPKATEAPVNGSRETPPPGVPTLRLHRPPDEPENSDQLPRRVRQANLAPQLRGQRSDESPEPPASDADDERTPELVRARMAAYRAGWVRGGGRSPGGGPTPDPEAGSDRSEGDPA